MNRALRVAPIALFTLFAALFLVQALTSLCWRMEHDTPLLHYAAFLMDRHGLVPYRDIFETSMPGTLAFHFVVGRLFGYGDDAFRAVDLALLALLLGVTFGFMRRFGGWVAAWSAVLFGLVYLSHGQTMSLQRDYLGVIPIACALLCIPARIGPPVGLWRFGLVGLLFGLSVLLKPHLAIALPIVFGGVLAFRRRAHARPLRDVVRCAAVTAGAFLLPPAVALLWLSAHGALGPFAAMVFDYLPLHNSMSGDQVLVTGLARVRYLVTRTLTFGGYGPLLLCALLGYSRALERAKDDRATALSLACLGASTLAYAIYPALAGKFWPYHYMPFAYFCSISAGLCLTGWRQSNAVPVAERWKSALLPAALAVALAVQLPLLRTIGSVVTDLRSGRSAHAPKGGRVDAIAGWLKPRLRPGDTVQPLDWTGGSIHAMLLAEARLATPFLYDYHFYHHASSPVVRRLRQSFVRQLRAAPPRFLIEVVTLKPWVSGHDSTREFPELRQFIADGYAMAFEGDGYRILERTIH